LIDKGLIEKVINTFEIVDELTTRLIGIESNKILKNLEYMNILLSNLKGGVKILKYFDELIENVNDSLFTNSNLKKIETKLKNDIQMHKVFDLHNTKTSIKMKIN